MCSKQLKYKEIHKNNKMRSRSKKIIRNESGMILSNLIFSYKSISNNMPILIILSPTVNYIYLFEIYTNLGSFMDLSHILP